MRPVIFDLDGTLIDSLPNVTDAANALLAEMGIAPIGTKTVAGLVGWGEQVFIDKLIAKAGLDFGRRAEILERFLVHYKVAGRDTRLMPGVEAALKTLADLGIPLGLVTNKPRGPLLPALEATVLGKYLDAVIAGDDLPMRKPDPEPLREAARRLGSTCAIYVGDSEVDAETAKRAGFPFILYTLGMRRVALEDMPHDAAFENFRDLPGIIRDVP